MLPRSKYAIYGGSIKDEEDGCVGIYGDVSWGEVQPLGTWADSHCLAYQPNKIPSSLMQMNSQKKYKVALMPWNEVELEMC